jgi:hypothetical protein
LSKTVVLKGINPKDLIGRTKAPLTLVPAALPIITSVVMRLGAKKYGPYNWRLNKVLRTVYLEAAMRHILSALDGEDVDPESGVPHEAHAAACMGIVLDALVTGNLVDDRPTPGAAAKLLGILQAVDKSNGELSFLAALAGEKPRQIRRRISGKKSRVRRRR